MVGNVVGVVVDAGLVKAAGLAIDLDHVQELTGYKLEKAPETPYPAPGFGLNSRKDGQTPLQNVEKPLQNAPGFWTGNERETRLRPFLDALRKGCKPLAAEVEDLLAALETGGPRPVAAEKAKALLAKLPEMVPSDPALASAVAEEMVKAYGSAFADVQPAAANKTDAKGNEHDYGNGQFTKKDGGASGVPSATT